MNQKICTLANQMRSGKDSGEKFVLMLGAGASLSSGVKKTTQIMAELLDKYGSDIEGPDLRSRFNVLWQRLSEPQRNEYLSPYLDAEPSPGYARLVNLIRKGYFDTIVTFNFDRLLERALTAGGLREDDDFKPIIYGDFSADRVVTLAAMRTPRIKILKLHGSLTGATFLWSEREMLFYPPPVENLVKDLTKRPVIVCGYGFADVCVTRAFATDGGPIFCVNPGGVPGVLGGFMSARRSDAFTIESTDGEFDSFFAQVDATLSEVVAPPPKRGKNPFKYLESYETADSRRFLGRDEQAADLVHKIEQSSFPLICVMGPVKSGKTSLIRAGVLGRIDEQRFLPVYVRCRGSLDQTLDTELPKWLPGGPGEDSGVALLKKLAEASPQHVVLILDQFERVLNVQANATTAEQTVRKLVEAKYPNLIVVCVCTNELDPWALIELARRSEMLRLDDIAPAQMIAIVADSARQAGISFGETILHAIQDEYARGVPPDPHRFSLAHVQAVCHVLFEQGGADLEFYSAWMRDNRATLDLAINHFDIINFIEDVPNTEERCLLRDLIRLVSHKECNEVIINYVREHVCGMGPPAAASAGAAAGGAAGR